MSHDKDTGVMPLIEEVLHVGKRQVATGRTRARTVTREDEELIRQDLVQEAVEVTRVPVELEVEEPPIDEDMRAQPQDPSISGLGASARGNVVHEQLGLAE